MKVLIRYNTDTESFKRNLAEAHNAVLSQAFTAIAEGEAIVGLSGIITPLKDTNGLVVGSVGVSK